NLLLNKNINKETTAKIIKRLALLRSVSQLEIIINTERINITRYAYSKNLKTCLFIVFCGVIYKLNSGVFSGKKGIKIFAGIKALDRKSTRLNSSHVKISYADFCLKKKKPLRRAIPCRPDARYP